ncbi:hypothetical protein NKH77_46925 [Streptomyces sp. M19]
MARPDRPRQVARGIDPEAGLKEPVFENLEIPEKLGPATVLVDDHKIKRYAFTQDDYHPWHFEDSPSRAASATPDCSRTTWCSCSPPATPPAAPSGCTPRNSSGSTAPPASATR